MSAVMSMSAVAPAPVMGSRKTSGVSARRSGFVGGTTAAFAPVQLGGAGGARRGELVIVAAATKEKKARDINILKTMINREDTLLVAGIKYQGLSVKQMIQFRRELPPGASLVIAKNTLMIKAAEGTKFEAISECCTGMNAWLFVDENIAPTVKGINKLTKEWNKEGKEVDFSGAVLDGKFISPADMKPLENLPTKLDLITKIACGIKQVPTKLARGTKGVPLKLAYGVKAIADGESDLINE